MNLFKNKILKKLLYFFPFASALAVVSCGSPEANTPINAQEGWDDEITLTYRFENSDKWDKAAFLKLLSDEFNKLKNADNELKNLSNVTFKLHIIGETNKMLQDLKADKKDVDLGIIPYYAIEDEDTKNNFPLFVAQTGTLKFQWTPKDDTFYVNGSITDPLREVAQKENTFQFGKPFGEFRTWKDEKETYGWDGSKYEVFYQPEKYTYVYRGSILIAGTEAERKEIQKAWDEKNWNAFVSHGIIFKNTTSGGRFRYQTSLIAQHFNNTFKNTDEVKQYFSNRNNAANFLTGKTADSIGQLQGNGKTYNIAFDDEGAFNWTPKNFGANLYNPTNPNSNVRVLTVTNPAPYDAVLGRVGLNKKQSELIGKALEKIKSKNNTLGIFTGYNYFKSGKDVSFDDFFTLQKSAADSIGVKFNKQIPKIEN